MVEALVTQEDRRPGARSSDAAWQACKGEDLGWGSGDESTGTELPALDGRLDPVLAELWDNPRDAAYDQL